MANNYLTFSFAIPLDTPEKTEWAKRAVAYLNSAGEQENIERLIAIDGFDADAADPGETAPEAHEFDALLPEGFAEEEYIGFIATIDEDGIWIYSDESGTPDHVVPLAQEFLLKFDPRGYIAFEWAETCSRPILDQFGGGAIFITATSVQYTNTVSWVNERVKEHEEATS